MNKAQRNHLKTQIGVAGTDTDFLQDLLPSMFFTPALLGAFLVMLNVPLLLIRKTNYYIQDYLYPNGKRFNTNHSSLED